MGSGVDKISCSQANGFKQIRYYNNDTSTWLLE